jgi:hypothetical protein
MGIISDEYLTIQTNLSLDEAVSRLSQAIKPEPSRQGYSQAGFAFDNLGRFEGFVNHEGFTLQRKGWFADIGWLTLRGHFKAERNGVRINVRMALSSAIRLFAVAWYALILIMLVASTIRGVRSGSFDMEIVGAPAFGLFFYIRILYSRVRERHKALRFLRALYQD